MTTASAGAPRLRRRDYSLLGGDGRRAEALGLAAAEWYHSEVSRKDMKALMQRADQPALRDTILWLGLMAGFAAAAAFLYPSPWSVPFFLAYGVLYGSASDSRWHECGHGTAFRTPWMNQVVYQIACFMIMRNPVTWRWSHSRHHTDTYIVGRDPEIAVMRPPVLAVVVFNMVGVVDVYIALKSMLYQALTGQPTPAERSYVPDTEWGKAVLAARVWLAIYAATAAVAWATHSLLPVLLIGAPRLYGVWHAMLCGLQQHGGLADNVLDHRLNSRTVHMNPVSRFIYWNMNYHIEHHMFPMVPYHALPRLHALIKDDLPAAAPSQWAAFGEILPAWARQLRGEDYFLKRDLPPSARPYNDRFYDTASPTASA